MISLVNIFNKMSKHGKKKYKMYNLRRKKRKSGDVILELRPVLTEIKNLKDLFEI